jgi:LuxR family maltose regulon positive regulatory protein
VLAQASTKDFGMVRPEELELLERLREASGAAALAGSPAVASAPPAEAGVATVDPLTRRELELLELLSQGLSNQQIADRVSLSVPTIKWHFYNLYAKLQVKSRAAALAKARSLLLLSR